ncbi:beta-mannosidase [Parapedobacter indicus]|uniref:Beta-mannosidase n=2 Tax=Parapedobacter indicus TaxID=1477437 RepID=A0A1I3GWK2_9SPHI|nr:beta-mannosidase [Parapedobacter indicus]SFI27783.1 beta-mannosidase [Parapedobacter indicus]
MPVGIKILDIDVMRKRNVLLFSWAIVMLIGELHAQPSVRHLESPYYIFPRQGSQHIDLAADWLLTSEEDTIKHLEALAENDWFNVTYPTSVQMAHYHAGKLGNPYEHAHALEHEQLEQKVWYYKKRFDMGEIRPGERALLCFDGVDYFAKVWVNGQLMGAHRGIFGGPSIDVTDWVVHDSNEVIVEVRSANYRNSAFDNRKPGNIVKGWFLTGGSGMEPFFNLGLWRGIRIERIPAYHMDRPFFYTKVLKDNQATLGFSLEIFSGKHSLDYQLHPWRGQQVVSSSHFPEKGREDVKVPDELTVSVDFLDEGKVAFSKAFKPHVIEGRCFLEDTFVLDNPKLWYPNGLGDPDFYQVQVSLQVNGKTVDVIDLDFGVRTIEQVRSAGIRTTDRWHNWQFVVNGKKFFVKGINWMPVDALYDLTPDKYDWAVRMAKAAGFQMFRIWGSALLESKEFYEACNKYGIMVWQDFNIANFDTPDWPQEVWEAQVCQNIFRLRNEPSLAVWCGGNEFNPYSYGNAASIGIVERNLAIFDPTRAFVRTSPDGGSIHAYPDFDPRWYRAFDLTPFVSETGIHSITDSKGIREVVDNRELENLGGMYAETFRKTHPEFVMHFAEYNPSRVPRMLSRASHIDDMANPSLEAIAEATQVAAGEFYQVMAEAIQANYPVTTGLMPWVYKRPWPVVAAIHLVDGFGQPSAPYYFLKRTYVPTRITIQIDRLLWAAGERFPMEVKVLNGVDQPGFAGRVHVQVFDDLFQKVWSAEDSIDVKPETSVTTRGLPAFDIPDHYKSRFFFVLAELYDAKGNLISRADYWPRTIPQMESAEYHSQYVAKPMEWPTLEQGPWLKPAVAKTRTQLALRINRMVNKGNGLWEADVSVENHGNYPSFMTQLEIEGTKRLFFADDNFFWLQPGESKEIHLEMKLPEEIDDKPVNLVLSSWNADADKKQFEF